MARTPIGLRCGKVAGPLFVGVFTVAGGLRPGYRQLRQPVSALALEDGGWVQTANFLIAGTLTTAFSRAARTRLGHGPGSDWIPRCLAAVGGGLIGAGLFRTDPVAGYPPGTPAPLRRPTPRGAMHTATSLPVFAGLAAAALIDVRRSLEAGRRGRAALALAAAATTIGGLFGSGSGFANPGGLGPVAGLLQRASILSGLGWMSWLAWRLERQP